MKDGMTDIIQVLTTTGTQEEAQALSQALVERRLAACVQVIGPIKSTYRWEGGIETAEEWLCLVKSRIDLYPDLEEAIRDLHPYQVPEILAVPVVAGSEEYVEWLRRETDGGKERGET